MNNVVNFMIKEKGNFFKKCFIRVGNFNNRILMFFVIFFYKLIGMFIIVNMFIIFGNFNNSFVKV